MSLFFPFLRLPLLLLLIGSLSVTPDRTRVSAAVSTNDISSYDYNEYELLHDLEFDKSDLTNYKAMIDTGLRVLCHFSKIGKPANPMCSACAASLRLLVESLLQQEEWAIVLADSMVKLPVGFLEGTFSFVSSFDECIKLPPYDLLNHSNVAKRYPEITRQNITQIRGSYCSIKLKVSKPSGHHPKKNVTGLAALLAKEEKGLKDVQEFMDEFPGFLGVCLPSPCKTLGIKSIQNAMKFFINLLASKKPDMPVDISTEVVSCTSIEDIRRVNWTLAAKLALAVLALLAVFVLFGTLADAIGGDQDLSESETRLDTSYDSENDDPSVLTKMGNYFQAISLRRSLRQLFNTQAERKIISCIAGLQVLSLIWIIIGNTALLRAYNLTTNLKEMQKSLHDIVMQFALNSPLALDTIFCAFGIVMAYTLGRASKSKIKRIPYGALVKSSGRFLLTRMIRFVPAYFMLIWLLTCFFSTMGAGPTWEIESKRFLAKCPDNWWWNLLHINNMFPNQEQCMPHAWIYGYLFQAMLLGFVACFTFKRSEIFTRVILSILIVLCVVITFIVNYSQDLGPTMLLREHAPGTRHGYVDQIGMRIFTRGAPFFVGLMGGFFLVGKKVNVSTPAVVAIWAFILAILLGIANATYTWNLGTAKLTPLLAAAYDATHRLLWSLAIVLFVMCCHSKKGGLFNSLTSWKGWIPLQRLSPVMYLIHPFVIFHGNGTTKMVQYYTFRLLAGEILWNIIVSMVVSLVVYCVIEAPFLALRRKSYKQSSRAPRGRRYMGPAKPGVPADV